MRFGIFFRRKCFRSDPSLDKNVTDILVILDMLFRDRFFTPKIPFFHVEVRDLGRKVLGGDGDGREEIRERAVLRNIHPLLHLAGSKPAKKRFVSFAPDAGKPGLVNSPFVDVP